MSALEPLKSGQTIIGGYGLDEWANSANDTTMQWIPLGAITKDPILQADMWVDGVTAGEACTGTPEAPTAPPGKLCAYRTNPALNAEYAAPSEIFMSTPGKQRGFAVILNAQSAGSEYATVAVWAYTEP